MQGELFKMSGPVVDASKVSNAQGRWMDQFRVTLRPDHLLIVGILTLVLYVLVFSFGVEKGKRYASEERAAEKAKQEQISKELVQSSIPALSEKSRVEVPVTPAPVAAPSLTGQYTIQIITFTNKKRAEEEVERIKKAGHQSFIIPSGKFFQVCTDAFQNIGEAKETLDKLRADGFAPPDAYIRPFNGSTTV